MAKPAVKISRPAKHDRRKTLIREEAAKVFAENGFRGATMQQVADACGMHKASVYHYYRSKDAILFDILTFADQEISDLIDREEVKDISDLEKVGRFVSSHVAWYLHHPAIARVAFQEWMGLSGEALDIQRERRRRYGHFVRNKIEQCQTQGLIPAAANPLVMSNFINGAVAAANIWFNPDGPATADAIAEEFGKIAISIVSGTVGPARGLIPINDLRSAGTLPRRMP